MARRLLLSELVQEQIDDLYDFYDSQQVGKGGEFIDIPGETLLGISERPTRWQMVEAKERALRRAVIMRPAVVVLYSHDDQTIYVSGVRDARSE
jgi:plasmid stabilization system protein ParE